MIYHYCRVSSKEQNLDRQLEILSRYKKADKVFTDKQSGKNFARDDYQKMKSVAVENDEIIIEELDRLGRNKEEIKTELEWFKSKGIVVRILDVPTTLIDFQGQDWIKDMVNNVIIEVLGSIAEQERIKILKRQREGIDAMQVIDGKKVSRRTGKTYGRQSKQTPDFEKYLQKQKDGVMTVSECCEAMGISRSLWYKKQSERAVS
jgi:DNA invertase Pin-like site-specific DNA recombinase